MKETPKLAHAARFAMGLCLLAGASVGSSVWAQNQTDPRVRERSYVFPATRKTVPFMLFVPSTYAPNRSWPVIVGLHGFGADHRALVHYDGLIDFAQQGGYIMVSPLGYESRGGFGGLGPGVFPGIQQDQNQEPLPSNLGELSEMDVMNVLEIVRREFNVDRERIYLFGHSMGGTGAFHLAAKYPEIWAAVAVAAPGNSASPDDIDRFQHIPTLVLKGDRDETVPVAKTRALVARMKQLGMQHLYVEIKGGDHSEFITEHRDVVKKVFAFFDIARKDQRPFPR